jgi:hypothetical protein
MIKTAASDSTLASAKSGELFKTSCRDETLAVLPFRLHLWLAPVLVPEMRRKSLVTIVATKWPLELEDQRQILLQATHLGRINSVGPAIGAKNFFHR